MRHSSPQFWQFWETLLPLSIFFEAILIVSIVLPFCLSEYNFQQPCKSELMSVNARIYDVRELWGVSTMSRPTVVRATVTANAAVTQLTSYDPCLFWLVSISGSMVVKLHFCTTYIRKQYNLPPWWFIRRLCPRHDCKYTEWSSTKNLLGEKCKIVN